MTQIENKNLKIKGRAYHNLAVGSELDGNLERALEWAIKSNENYQDKNTATYIQDLEHRIAQEQHLRKQILAKSHFFE